MGHASDVAAAQTSLENASIDCRCGKAPTDPCPPILVQSPGLFEWLDSLRRRMQDSVPLFGDQHSSIVPVPGGLGESSHAAGRCHRKRVDAIARPKRIFRVVVAGAETKETEVRHPN